MCLLFEIFLCVSKTAAAPDPIVKEANANLIFDRLKFEFENLKTHHYNAKKPKTTTYEFGGKKYEFKKGGSVRLAKRGGGRAYGKNS